MGGRGLPFAARLCPFHRIIYASNSNSQGLPACISLSVVINLCHSLCYRCHFVIWFPFFVTLSFYIVSSLLWWRGWSIISWSWASCTGSHPVTKATCHVLLLVSWFENLETAHQRLVDAHHGARVIEFSAIVRSGKKCD